MCPDACLLISAALKLVTTAASHTEESMKQIVSMGNLSNVSASVMGSELIVYISHIVTTKYCRLLYPNLPLLYFNLFKVTKFLFEYSSICI